MRVPRIRSLPEKTVPALHMASGIAECSVTTVAGLSECFLNGAPAQPLVQPVAFKTSWKPRVNHSLSFQSSQPENTLGARAQDLTWRKGVTV